MFRVNDIKEGRASRFCSSFLLPLYSLTRSRGTRSIIRRAVLRIEAGPVYSLTIREIFRRFHRVDVGLYTIGPCEVEPGNLVAGTSIGRYSSIYYTVRTIARDHPGIPGFPPDPIRGSGMFKEAEGASPGVKLVIGSDVWIGHNAILLPSVERIGDGAVIGAGSVVHSNVPPYAVVTGNPARVVRFRFSEKKIRELLESQWWMRSIDELSGEIEEFQKPLEGCCSVQ